MTNLIVTLIADEHQIKIDTSFTKLTLIRTIIFNVVKIIIFEVPLFGDWCKLQSYDFFFEAILINFFEWP